MLPKCVVIVSSLSVSVESRHTFVNGSLVLTPIIFHDYTDDVGGLFIDPLSYGCSSIKILGVSRGTHRLHLPEKSYLSSPGKKCLLNIWDRLADLSILVVIITPLFQCELFFIPFSRLLFVLYWIFAKLNVMSCIGSSIWSIGIEGWRKWNKKQFELDRKDSFGHWDFVHPERCALFEEGSRQYLIRHQTTLHNYHLK